MLNKIRKLSENTKIVIKNTAGAFVVKGFSLVLSLFTMPAYFRFFGDNNTLGMWFSLLSVMNWILNFDLGIGNGLRNKLSASISKGEAEETKRLISSSYIAISLICGVIIIAFAGCFWFVDWNVVFSIDRSQIGPQVLETAVLIVFAGIILQMVIKLVTSVLYAMQKSSVNNFLHLSTTIITVVSLMLLPSGTNEENIIRMAIIHSVAMLLPQMIASVFVYNGEQLKGCWPSIKHFSAKHAKDVLSLGIAFLFVQTMYLVVVGTNEYLITQFSGNAAVVDYQIYYKPFGLGSTLVSLALTPIWSVVTKAFAERNLQWIKRLYNTMMKFAVLGILAQFAIIVVLQFVVDFWLSENTIAVNYWYAMSFAVLGSLMILNSVFSSIANGLGKLKVQAACFTIGAAIKVPLAWVLVQLMESWVGVVFAAVISMGVYCVVQPIYINKYLTIEEV